MQHSDKIEPWSQRKIRSTIVTKQNYTEVVIWHKKTSYFILYSMLTEKTCWLAVTQITDLDPRPNRLGSSRAAVKVHWLQHTPSSSELVWVFYSWWWVTCDVYEWLVHEMNNHSTYKLARAFKSAKMDGIHLSHNHLCILHTLHTYIGLH